MVVPIAELSIPPTIHLVLLISSSVIIATLLYSIQPPMTQRTVVAFIPWVLSGAILHSLYQLGKAFQVQLYPQILEPLFSSPAVYLTIFVAMGTVWLFAAVIRPQSATVTQDEVSGFLGFIGFGVMLALLGIMGWQAADPAVGPLQLVLPIGGLLLSLLLSFIMYILLGSWRTYIIAEAGTVGGLVLFAHVFDAITLAIGVELLDIAAASEVAFLFFDFARSLPTYQYIGAGWLFVAVKALFAIAIIAYSADYIRNRPTRGNLLFAVIMIIGLAPALNNFFLFILNL